MNHSPPAMALELRPVAVQECMDEALLDGPRLIQHWTQGVMSALWSQAQHPGPEAQGWRQAHEHLQTVRPVLQGLWVRHWHAAMERTTVAPHSRTNLRFDTLEFMDSTEIQATVEAARMEQAVLTRVRGAFDAWVQRLNRILAPAQRTTTTTHSPLRPETALQALTETLLTVCPDDRLRASWLQVGHSPLIDGLQQLYGLLDRVLDQHGPLLDESWPEASPPPSATSSGSAPHTQITLSELHQLLVSDWSASTDGVGSPAAPRPVTPAPSAPISASHAQDHTQDDTVWLGADFHSPPGVPSAPSGSWAAPPSPPAASAGNTIPSERRRRPRGGAATASGSRHGPMRVTDLAEEVVGLMLDSISKDDRLLPPMVQALQQLRPALLQVAREEPRFFADRENPARRLLDELTQRSLAYAHISSPGFSNYLAQVQSALNSLHPTASASGANSRASERFSDALDSLSRRVSSSSTPPMPSTTDTPDHQEQVVAHLLHAEQRYLLADKIRKQLEARPDVKASTPELQVFIGGLWAQVIAHARLQPTQAQEAGRLAADERYLQLVPDLMWSCDPSLAAQQPNRLVRIMPVLLRNLREGLQRIDCPSADMAQVLRHVMHQHEKGLKKQGLAPPPAAAVEQQPEHPHRADPSISPIPTIHGVWQATQPFDLNDFAPTEPFTSPPPQAPSLTTQEAGGGLELHVGAWVEIDHPPGQQQRVRLSWISPHGTMYLFLNAAGASVSLSRTICQRLFAQQRLRLVAMQSMVDDALNAVMAAAVRNSAIGH